MAVWRRIKARSFRLMGPATTTRVNPRAAASRTPGELWTPKLPAAWRGQVGITPARLPDEAQVAELQGIGIESGHGGEHIRHPGKLPLPHQPIPGEIEFASLLPGRVPPVREFGEDLGIRVPGQAGRHPSHAPVQGGGQRFPVVDATIPLIP